MGIEIEILNFLQRLRTPAGDVLMPMITKLGDGGVIWILLTAFLLFIPKTRKTGAILGAALCVDVLLCNGILKNLTARIRPFDVNSSVRLLIAAPKDFSFPSGHTAAAFASVTALYFAGEKVMWKATLALSIIIAFSRLYLYVHYPSDILGGILIGVISGFIGFRIVSYALARKNL